MLLDLRSLEEVAAAPAQVGGSLGYVVWDSTWQRPVLEEIPTDKRIAILALYASGALTEDEFMALLAA